MEVVLDFAASITPVWRGPLDAKSTDDADFPSAWRLQAPMSNRPENLTDGVTRTKQSPGHGSLDAQEPVLQPRSSSDSISRPSESSKNVLIQHDIHSFLTQ